MLWYFGFYDKYVFKMIVLKVKMYQFDVLQIITNTK